MAYTPKLVTRQETTTTRTTETLNKNQKLSFQEMDENFLQLQKGSISVVGDDSTGTEFKHGDTLKVAGTGGIATSVSGDTVTIDASSIVTSSLGDLTAVGSTLISPSNADITLDPAGTGQVVLNASTEITHDSTATPALSLQTAVDTAAAGPILELKRTVGASPNVPDDGDVLGQIQFNGVSYGLDDRTYATIQAVAVDVDTGTEDGKITITTKENGSDVTRTQFTSSGIETINGGNITSVADITGDRLITDGITIQDANITGTQSNQNIVIEPSGTGDIELSTDGIRLGRVGNDNVSLRTDTDSDYNLIISASKATGESSSTLQFKGVVDATTYGITEGDISFGLANESNEVTVSTSENSTRALSIQFPNSDGPTLIPRAYGESTLNQNLYLDGLGTGHVLLDSEIKVKDNSITTTNSNQDLQLGANGTGNVSLLAQTSLNSNKIINLADPTASQDAATKAYVDSLTGGGPVLGDLTITGSTISAPSNADLTLQQGGTGSIVLDSISIRDNIISTNTSNADLELTASGTGTVKLNSDVNFQGNATLSWDDTDKTIIATYTGYDRHLNIGQETQYYAKASAAISAGDVVMFTGVQGDHITVAKADATATGFIPEWVVGVAKEAMALNDFGYITAFGKVTNLTTNTFTAGDLLWLDPATPGGFVNTAPNGANDYRILVAAVITSSAGNGIIQVRPTIEKTHAITVVGDDSTGTQVNLAETFKIAGTQNVSTAVSGDTLTITGPDLTSYITASSSDTLTNKTIDANGTGNSISNLEVADFAATSIVTQAEGISSNNNDTTIPTSAAVKAYADSVGGGGATGLTFVGDDSTGTLISDGETIKIAGGTGITTAMSGDTLTITATGGGGGSTGDLIITGSTISTPSNANLTLDAGGTGLLKLAFTDGGGNHTFEGTSGANIRLNPFGSTGIIFDDEYTSSTYFSSDYRPGRFIEGLKRESNIADVSTKQRRFNRLMSEVQLDTQTSSSSNARFRNLSMELAVDLNGSTITPSSTYNSRGPQSYYGEIKIENTSASKATLSHMAGMNLWTDINANTGEIEITQQTAGYITNLDATGAGGATVANHIDFMGGMVFTDANTAMTNYYTLYAKDDVGAGGGVTNKYLISAENQDFLSEIGTLKNYKEKIGTLTSSASITVDCSTAPVHTVTLDHNATFTISNLSTGKSVTLIITQGTTGGTGTFTSVLFAGGDGTLSTGSGTIDVLTIFNDGTNLLGSLAKAFS